MLSLPASGLLPVSTGWLNSIIVKNLVKSGKVFFKSLLLYLQTTQVWELYVISLNLSSLIFKNGKMISILTGFVRIKYNTKCVAECFVLVNPT